jgi:hypothetical protein
VPLCYMRDPVTTTPEAQYCMRPQQALPAGGEDEQVLGGPEIEAEEFADMPPLETERETESKGSEYVDLQPLEYEQYEQERGVPVPSALANAVRYAATAGPHRARRNALSTMVGAARDLGPPPHAH